MKPTHEIKFLSVTTLPSKLSSHLCVVRDENHKSTQVVVYVNVEETEGMSTPTDEGRVVIYELGIAENIQRIALCSGRRACHEF